MAATPQIATLMSDHERYDTTFKEYCKRTKKYEVLADWISSSFPTKVVKELSFNETDELKMLGVGSGSGEVETCALKQLLKKWPKIQHTVIEPNSGLASRFKNLVTKEENKLAGVSFNWHQETIDQFRKTADQSNKYHLIMIVQVLYYVDDVEDTLKYLTSLLVEGGLMVVVIVSEESCFWRVAERFPQLQSKIQHAICNIHIQDMLAANQITFHTEPITNSIDATGCFEEDSDEADMLIDFVSQVAYLKKQASKSLYDDVIDLLKSDKVCLPKGDDEKMILFKSNWDAIYVHK